MNNYHVRWTRPSEKADLQQIFQLPEEDLFGANDTHMTAEASDGSIHGFMRYNIVKNLIDVYLILALDKWAAEALIQKLFSKIVPNDREQIKMKVDYNQKEVLAAIKEFKDNNGLPMFGTRSEDDHIVAEYPRTNVSGGFKKFVGGQNKPEDNDMGPDDEFGLFKDMPWKDQS